MNIKIHAFKTKIIYLNFKKNIIEILIFKLFITESKCEISFKIEGDFFSVKGNILRQTTISESQLLLLNKLGKVIFLIKYK